MAAEHVILLVNNIPDHAVTYGRALVGQGFQVHLVRSGKGALELIRRTLPTCVVIDLRLPDMSGWELCRRLRTGQHGKDLRIVVLTPELSKTCAADSARAGCDAWLAHPTIAEDMVRTVKRVLNLQTAMPSSPDEALLGGITCAACGAEEVRPTLRMGSIQYYCCGRCRFCWRVEFASASP
jgi:CheY-like chemotaxis protein